LLLQLSQVAIRGAGTGAGGQVWHLRKRPERVRHLHELGWLTGRCAFYLAARRNSLVSV
jgi:hypothetical protein